MIENIRYGLTVYIKIKENNYMECFDEPSFLLLSLLLEDTWLLFMVPRWTEMISSEFRCPGSFFSVIKVSGNTLNSLYIFDTK